MKKVVLTEVILVHDAAKIRAYAKQHAEAWGMHPDDMDDLGTAVRESVVLHRPEPDPEALGIELVISTVVVTKLRRPPPIYAPAYTDGVGIAAQGLWVWGVEKHGLPGRCGLPAKLYRKLKGYLTQLPPRERGDSPLKGYLDRDEAMAALEQAGGQGWPRD